MCPLGKDHDVPCWLTTRILPSLLVTTPPALCVFFIHFSLSHASPDLRLASKLRCTESASGGNPKVVGSSGGTPHPGCFGKRSCKRLKIKETSAEKSAKRRQRGRKLLKEMDLPQRNRAHRESRGALGS